MTHEEKLEIIREVMSERGRKGGSKTRDKNPNHFREMAQKSAEVRREKAKQRACKEV